MRISDWSSDVCSSDLHLRRKCFVELDEVDVAPANPGSREEPLDRGYRPHTHARGVAARRGPAREPARRLESEFGELVLGNDETGSRRVILLARIPRGHDAPIARTEGSEAFERAIGAVSSVMIENRAITALLRARTRNSLHLAKECAVTVKS